MRLVEKVRQRHWRSSSCGVGWVVVGAERAALVRAMMVRMRGVCWVDGMVGVVVRLVGWIVAAVEIAGVRLSEMEKPNDWTRSGGAENLTI